MDHGFSWLLVYEKDLESQHLWESELNEYNQVWSSNLIQIHKGKGFFSKPVACLFFSYGKISKRILWLIIRLYVKWNIILHFLFSTLQALKLNYDNVQEQQLLTVVKKHQAVSFLFCWEQYNKWYLCRGLNPGILNMCTRRKGQCERSLHLFLYRMLEGVHLEQSQKTFPKGNPNPQ